VAETAPTSVIAEGLAAAFHSDKTPAFGQMLSSLFNSSTGDQKAGMINHLLSSLNPSTLTQVLSALAWRIS
jgi:K+-transporting ATPase A subunit